MNDRNEIGLIPLLKVLLLTFVEILVGFLVIVISVIFAAIATYLFYLFFNFIL